MTKFTVLWVASEATASQHSSLMEHLGWIDELHNGISTRFFQDPPKGSPGAAHNRTKLSHAQQDHIRRQLAPQHTVVL